MSDEGDYDWVDVADDDDVSCVQTLAAAADAVESGGKSPVSALNELGVRVAYSVLRQGGPAHCPSFHVAVTVSKHSSIT